MITPKVVLSFIDILNVTKALALMNDVICEHRLVYHIAFIFYTNNVQKYHLNIISIVVCFKLVCS